MWVGFHWVAIPLIYGSALLSFILYRRRALLFLLCLVFLMGGMIRYESTVSFVDDTALQFYNDQGIVHIQGLVADDPDQTDRAVALRIDVNMIKLEDTWREVSGSVLVYAPILPAHGFLPADVSRDTPYYHYGDIIQVEGQMKTPEKLDDFDWQAYLANKGIHSVMSRPDSMELIEYGKGFAPRLWLYQLRNRMSESLETALHEPQGALAQAIVIGERGSLPDELKESFARTGTSHMIAISGLHIAIAGGIALALGVALFGRKRSFYLLIAMGAIWGYALLTGMHAPALRAAIMVSLWLFADHIGRPRSAMTSLLFAAAIMIGISPSILHEVSFQMSFSAMAGLMLLTPKFQSAGRRYLKVPDEGRSVRGFFVDSFAVTMGAVIATLPIIAFYFHQISLVVLPTNLIALPALPFVIGSSALVAVIGIPLPGVAEVVGWIAWLCMSFMIEVIEFFAALPFASIAVEDVGVPFVWGYYVILCGALWLGSNRLRFVATMGGIKTRVAALPNAAHFVPAKFFILPLVLVAVLVWTAAITSPDSRLHIFFLDIGQGDAILIQRGYHQILVDGGPNAEKLCVELGDRLPFWDRTIEMVVLTHPDADHLAGLVEVLERYEVNQILISGHEHNSALYAEWLRLIEEKDVERIIAEAGQTIGLGGDLAMEVLHPGPSSFQQTASDTNANSVVTRLVCQDFSLLLTGDIPDDVEQMLCDRMCTLDSIVYKVPHHGSDSSSCSDFLSAVDPQVAVISAGIDNKFGHPDPDVVERLEGIVGDENIYLTADQGTIELITDGGRMWVETER